MIGALIGGALKVGGAIAGGIASSRAAQKANQMISDQKKKNQAWYDRNYNADYTQRSDAQAVLNNTREMLKQRYDQSAATSTVMGGTDEALAMQRAAANQTVSDTMSDMNAQASTHKDMIEQQYMNQDAALSQQQIEIQQQKAQNIAAAAGGASDSAAGIVGSIFKK